MIINGILSLAVGAMILAGAMLVCVAIGRATDDDYRYNDIDHFWTGFAVFIFLGIFCALSFGLGYIILYYLGLFG